MSFWRDTFPFIAPQPAPHILDCCPGRLMLRARTAGASALTCPLIYQLAEDEPPRAWKKLETIVTRRWIGNETESVYFTWDYTTVFEQPGPAYRINGEGEECEMIVVTPPEEPDPEDIPELDEPDTGFVFEDDPLLNYSDEVTAGAMMSDVSAALVLSDWSEWRQIAEIARTRFSLAALEDSETWDGLVGAGASLDGGIGTSSGSATAVLRQVELALRGARIAGTLSWLTRTTDAQTLVVESEEPGQLNFSPGSGWSHAFALSLAPNKNVQMVNVIWEPLR